MHVSEVPRGLACRCKCFDCDGEMVAKKGSKTSHHFAHYKKSDCHGEGNLHKMAKKILLEQKRIMVTNPGTRKKENIIFSSGEEEVVRDSMRIDCLMVEKESKKELAVEIKVSNPVDSRKRYLYKKMNLDYQC